MSYSLDTAYRDQRGISLLEILLAIAIIAFVLIYLTRIIHFADTGNKAEEGRERMEQTAVQLKAYYRSHQVLPDPNATPVNSVPVGAQQLDLSQKHRLDPWGNYLLYFRAQKQDAYYPQATITDIIGYSVDGRRAAGVLISLGPDQVQSYTEVIQNNVRVLTSLGDDVLVPITLDEEALDIVMEELEFLDKRVVAYDRFFAGVKNGGRHIYFHDTQLHPDPPAPWEPYGEPDLRSYYLMDESGCVNAVGATNSVGCLATEWNDPNNPNANDPNCGRATIDNDNDNCLTALDDILQLYVYRDLGINVTAVTEPYHTDPWGNLYQWGSAARLGGTDPRSDPRYHLFFSMGPDGLTGPQGDTASHDDITPY
jgi:type II secretory pathway pseudopilin PulG